MMTGLSQAEDDLMDGYQNLSTRRVDLVGDYAGQELFFLEGDSLLLRVFSDPMIDYSPGFQMLHTVYATEHFLQGLIQRKCNFNIFFFDDHAELCIPPGTKSTDRHKFLLARSVIQRHLRMNLTEDHPSLLVSSLAIHSFSSVQDPAFNEHLSSTGVYFIMCHDGANPNSLNEGVDKGIPKDDVRNEIEAREMSRRFKFRSMICSLIQRGYNVALINGLEWQDTKVMTMVLEANRRPNLRYEYNRNDAVDHTPVKDLNEMTTLDNSLSVLERVLDNQKTEKTIPELSCKCKSSNPKDVAGLSESMIITLIAIAQMLRDEPSTGALSALFLMHTAFIASAILSMRRQATVRSDNAQKIQIDLFLTRFSDLSNAVLAGDMWGKFVESRSIICDISDLIDGRLFESIAASPGEILLGAHAESIYSNLTHLLCALSGIHLPIPPGLQKALDSRGKRNGLAPENVTILSFSNPTFDRHLASIDLNIPPSKVTKRQTGRIFQEVTHWHNAKKRLDPKNTLVTPATARDKFRALRRNQFFMAEMQSYAASLTNAAGKALEPEVVTLGGAPESYKDSKTIKPSVAQPQKGQKGKNAAARKGAGKKAMYEDIATNKALKDSENDERLFSTWRTVRKDLEAERSLRSKYLKIQTYLQALPDAKRSVLQGEVELHLLCILVEIYKRLRKETIAKQSTFSEQEVFGVASLIWDTARRLTSTTNLSKSILEQVQGIVKALNLPHLQILPPADERKLAYNPELLLPKGDELSVDMDAKEFQLIHCGPYMDRNLDSALDPRVPFHPDGWQRKVLDELDAENSVFVVAPTSAGKTFISFYAMEKILRRDDDSVLVYVAPTKALVNQIAAEIQARFRKSYKHAGKSVWAIHTRDYRINNPSGCQILVTVPHILQIMLLAPSNAKSWSPRLRNIIFDEIHSIGQAEDGVVWEQLLLLAPCPIIALSATVGNPKMFHSWLSSTQQSSGHKVAMIRHQHRYSDLRKFVFNPPKTFAFRGLVDRPSFATLGLDGIQGFSFIHPVASLINKSREIPDDLNLEARDCLTLYQAMKRYETGRYPVDNNLDPSNPSTLPEIICKSHVIKWEQRLKVLLKTWMSDGESPFDSVREYLSKALDESHPMEIQVSKGQPIQGEDDEFVLIESDNLYSTTLPLLCKLHERDALPAIFFNYDRHRCEGIGRAIVDQLVKAESRFKDSSSAWKAKLSGFQQYKKDQLKAPKTSKVVIKKKGKGEDDDDKSSKTDKMMDAAGEEANPYANFDPDAPVDGFHFAARHKAEASELSRYFYQMERRGLPSWMTDALKRGIGVHHAGMNRKYRQVVEMLFRKGFLRVVIATGTLALGINMPCATVVFSGDSIFLTALNFRQAAGRAGRRGFDLLGNVVFQNISHGKICRLISSRLPDLNGHFPVTTTLVLRLFTLLHESGDSPYAVKAINSLLSQPRLYLDGPAFKDQVLHHLRFSIEYLRRQDLLSANGAPINFAGLTSHLYFTENSSFALNALIKGEYFHELCSEILDKESHVLRTLMIVMAHLFGRRPCRQADAEFVDNIVKKSASIVFLPPMPTKAAQILRDHNQDTLEVFATYVRTFADQHITTEDCRLPLTGYETGGSNNDANLPGSLPPTKIRSPFVALSGHGDDFESISDLCRTARGGIFLEEAVIPHLDIYPDESKTPLNAYLYDFFMHGDIEALEKANGVKKSDVWFLLNDFSLVLATMTASLANFLKLPESDLSLLDITGEGDEQENAEDDQFADSTTDTDSTAASTATADTGRTSVTNGSSLASRPKTKKKVADSWDASEDEADDDAEAKGNEEEDLSKEELERGFLNMYKAMKKLRFEFDTKFRKIFA